MTKSIWKINKAGIYFLLKDLNKKFFKTNNRNIVINESLIGYEALVYNGQRYIKFTINDLMVGQKLGEFSPTKKTPIFIKKTNLGKKKVK